MSTESEDLSKFTVSTGVTGSYSPPMTRAERRAADEEYRRREAERTARIDALVERYELAEGTVIRDSMDVYWRLSVFRDDIHDAWWETFGDEGGWKLGEECVHGEQRARGSTECRVVKNCPGRIGPALPFTVVSH